MMSLFYIFVMKADYSCGSLVHKFNYLMVENYEMKALRALENQFPSHSLKPSTLQTIDIEVGNLRDSWDEHIA
jgi:hypothetical protein